MEERKAFTAHKANGIYLKFPNGNGISTIWSTGSYSDNHDFDFRKDDGSLDLERNYRDRIEQGSDTVEVMIDCKPIVLELLEAKFAENSAGGSVFGHLSISQWLEILNILESRTY